MAIGTRGAAGCRCRRRGHCGGTVFSRKPGRRSVGAVDAAATGWLPAQPGQGLLPPPPADQFRRTRNVSNTGYQSQEPRRGAVALPVRPPMNQRGRAITLHVIAVRPWHAANADVSSFAEFGLLCGLRAGPRRACFATTACARRSGQADPLDVQCEGSGLSGGDHEPDLADAFGVECWCAGNLASAEAGAKCRQG